MATAMSATDHLQCSCGFLAFRCIHFPEPSVMRLTCSGCGQTHSISMGAASNLTAWNAAEQATPTDVEPEQIEPVKRTGYRDDPLF